MKSTSLNGKWRMIGGGFDCIGNIPGSLFSFLLDNKLIDDPFYRDNEVSALALTYTDYSFERSFELSKTENPYILRFEGLDTLCDVYLNGALIASTDDMHITYEFDVTDAVVSGENNLKVVCHPIHELITEKHKELALDNVSELYPNS